MARMNILVIMVDQLNGTLFPDGPAPFLKVPHLAELAAASLRFNANYTASPLCAPARAAFMSGCLPSRTGVYDNAAEFPSSLPTFAHLLRRAGYRTCLSGKMHFVGPDQLHGFEERLTTDVYPADFGWTPDWTRPNERIDWWYHNLSSVTEAGVAEITNQLEFDDEVAHFARQRLYDFARDGDGTAAGRPFCLTVSFTHPHDPYFARRRFFDLYRDEDIPMPEVKIAFEDLDPHSQRLLRSCDHERFDITEAHVRRARHAYFAAISYLDAQIGSILDVLKDCRFDDNTAVVFTSDHGDMLGERGLWFKMSFFEGSARVPLLLKLPGSDGRAIDAPTSLLDVAPTLAGLGGAGFAGWEVDGTDLLATGAASGPAERFVAGEYAAEGSVAPLVMLRQGACKYVACPADPPQLFDLAADPRETDNLAGRPEHADIEARFADEAARRWDMEAFTAEVMESQKRRHLVYEALRQGGYYPWDYQPLRLASERYMRNHMDLNVLEVNARFPRSET
ncbi:choline-sulfatase [Afifella sp. IM 167]|uniref:choline-sulfatase n=1 Tax=Afifella sp. IM 167 TaxID=2033586 RepID=UPI001CD024FF|nr:choline-sulfatase [Afifella sp. IM 167]MBZ8135474.1 choline-sulfatase [Afifella sp. IM 167]